jgi:CRISPR-associated endoribonuclease Cas6
MRLLFRLRARQSVEYPRSNHDKVRGVVWNALEGTRFDAAHEDGLPVGVCTSNVFPWSQTIPEGDTRHFLVASPHEDALSAIARAHPVGSEFNIGTLPFTVEDVTVVEPDVGAPGTTGTLETSTGVYTRLSDDICEEYGIEPYRTGDTYWSSESDHPIGAFIDYVEQNLQTKHDQFHFPHLDGPAECEGRLFQSENLQKEFVVHIPVAQDQTLRAVLTKWRFDYRVRDADHRRNLQLALSTGIGGRNTQGLGFVNLVEGSKRSPGSQASVGSQR